MKKPDDHDGHRAFWIWSGGGFRAYRSAPLIKKIYVYDFSRFGLKDVGL
jgi:hypothetical protein